MVVQEERRDLSQIIAAYMRGEMDNFAFDEALDGRDWKDSAIGTIRRALWFTYCDLRRHRFDLSRSGWQFYRRVVAFLQTSLELPGDEKRAVAGKCWPFQDVGSILAERPDIERFGLPGREEIPADRKVGMLESAWNVLYGGVYLGAMLVLVVWMMVWLAGFVGSLF